MQNKLSLYAIYRVADLTDDEPFDSSVLPAQILPDVTIENVSSMFNQEPFKWVSSQLGYSDLRHLQSVRYAIVHRYQTGISNEGIADASSEKLIRKLAACLRLVRPMRQFVEFMQGVVHDGQLDVRTLDHPLDLMEVPEVQKHFHLRNQDIELFKFIAGDFLHAMDGEYWKFKMAIQFHEAGHLQLQTSFWKIRYILLCSDIEAVYTSKEHQGGYLAIERIKWFLDPMQLVYPPDDIPKIFGQSNLTIGDLLEDLYRIRNDIAHGNKISDADVRRIMRRDFDRDLNLLDVLVEALSVIIRSTLLRILRDKLLDHFVSDATANAYFTAAKLAPTDIQAKLKRTKAISLK